MKSLQQASKKANSELMKQTNKIKAKQEIERKKLEKKEEAARKRELADLEDADAEPHDADDPVACTWTVYKNLAAIGHCENKEVLDTSAMRTTLCSCPSSRRSLTMVNVCWCMGRIAPTTSWGGLQWWMRN